MATASKGATKQSGAKAPAKKPAAKAAAGKADASAGKAKASDDGKAAGKGAPARKPNAAFMKALTPSPELAAVVGQEPLPRTEVVKKLWEYIKKHDLQDPANKQRINADDKLQPIFGKSQVTMFEMTGLVGKHLT